MTVGDRDQIELHLMPVHAHPAAVSGSCLDASLDASELTRALRLRQPADRWLFVQAHALLRRVLSRHAAVSAQDWRFVAGAHGKPALCPLRHPSLQSLRFNLSHCAGHVAVAVAWGREVGVDIERLDAPSADEDLARTVLAPGELPCWQGLGAHGARAQQHFLVARWTFKEAVLKSLGIGLGGIDPDRLEVVPVGEAQAQGWTVRTHGAQVPQALQSWAARSWLHGGIESGTHHWALACERQPAEVVGWCLVRHPPPTLHVTAADPVSIRAPASAPS